MKFLTTLILFCLLQSQLSAQKRHIFSLLFEPTWSNTNLPNEILEKSPFFEKFNQTTPATKALFSQNFGFQYQAFIKSKYLVGIYYKKIAYGQKSKISHNFGGKDSVMFSPNFGGLQHQVVVRSNSLGLSVNYKIFQHKLFKTYLDLEGGLDVYRGTWQYTHEINKITGELEQDCCIAFYRIFNTKSAFYLKKSALQQHLYRHELALGINSIFPIHRNIVLNFKPTFRYLSKFSNKNTLLIHAFPKSGFGVFSLQFGIGITL